MAMIRLIASVGATLVAGCEGMQSSLHPRGPVAATLAETAWVMFIGALVITLLVTALLLYAAWRDPAKRAAVDGRRMIVIGGLVFPAVTLTALFVYGLDITQRVQPVPADALRIEVIGHQWWWEVRYPDFPDAVTANEIHIPVGRPVAITLSSADVIHSFWVPNLAGKVDALPQQQTGLWLQADEAGVYRGQCAEFCGGQHARMGLLVVAEAPADFSEWVTRQRRPKTATSAASVRGRTAFTTQGCNTCHTLRGAGATARIGPDLTHVNERHFIAAGTLPNNPDNLARWIRFNQEIKPGNAMLSFAHLDPQVVRDLVAFLRGSE